MSERQPRRLGRISGAFATALLIAACETGTPATPQPTKTPEATPSPTPTELITPMPTPTPTEIVIVTPSPTTEITPSPTIKPTEKPTPEPTPVSMRGLVASIVKQAEENGTPENPIYEDVSATTVNDSIKTAFESDPEAANTVFPTGQTYSEAAKENWKICKEGYKGSGGGNPELIREESCEAAVFFLFNSYNINEEESFITALTQTINWVENNLESPYKDNFLTTIKSYTA